MGDTDNTATAGEATEQQESTPKTFTQEEVDRIVGDRLSRERKNYEGFEEYKAAAEKLPTLESERNEWKGKAEKFEAEKERGKLAAKVAKDAGLPAEAAGVIHGETVEEMTAHAEQLKAILKPTGPIIPGQEKSPSKIEADPMREFARNLFENAKAE